MFLISLLCFVSARAESLTLQQTLELAAETNPSLRKAYAQVKSADAELHQAYLFQNPQLEARALWPRNGSAPLQEYGISYNLIDLFQRGARIEVNKNRRDATLLQALRKAVEIEKELKTAYYTVQGHTQALLEQTVLLEIAQIDAELAARQYEAGNIPAIELAEKKAALLQTRTLVYNRQMALFEARQELAKLLGRASEISRISVEEGPPDLPPASQKTGPALYAEALLQRHDFQSFDREIAALKTDRSRQNLLMFDETRLGYDYEREIDGEVLQGVSLSMPLPIFDQKQAVKEQLDALVEQQLAGKSELAQEIAAEINMSLVRMANARLRVEQLEELVPLREEILKLSRQQYNAMLIGAYQLLDFRGQGAVALMTLADAKADYWRAHAELEESLGKSILAGTTPFELKGKNR